MPSRTEEKPSKASVTLLEYGPFGGIDATSALVHIPPGLAADVLNAVPNRTYGALRPVRPPLLQTCITNFPGPITALTKFIRSQTASPVPVLLTAIANAGTQTLQFVPTNGGGYLSVGGLPFIAYTYGAGYPTVTQMAVVANGMFVPLAQYMFYTQRDPNGLTVKIDTMGNGYSWGIAPALWQASASEPLNIAGGTAIATNAYYTWTYSNATQESSPASFYGTLLGGPPINFSTQTPAGPPGPITFNGATIQLDAPMSRDPQVTTVNLYRIDNIAPQWLLVATAPNTSGYGGAAAGWVRFTDFVPSPPTGQALVQRRDPPAPFYAVCSHKGFVFGFGHDAFFQWSGANLQTFAGYLSFPIGASDLWYSIPGEPWSFDNTNQVIPINPNHYGDVAVNLASVGGGLVLLKTRSTWVLYGDSPADFQPPQEVGRNVGCVSFTSMVQALGLLGWASNLGIMLFDGSNLTNISHQGPGSSDIKTFYDNLTPTDIVAIAGTFDDGIFWFSFPTKQLSYGYHLASKSWWKVNFYAPLFATDPEEFFVRPGALDGVYAVNTVNIDNIDRWFSILTFPPTLGMLYTTRTWSTPSPHWWRFTYVKLDAPSSTSPITVTVTSNPGTPSAQTYSKTVTFGNNPFVIVSLPVALQGTQVNVTLTTTSGTDYQITKLSLYGYIERELTSADSN